MEIIRLLVVALMVHHGAALSTEQGIKTHSAVNPIRKVVSMLQAMEKQVTEEGEKDKEIYSKYMCYCKTSGSDLSDSIAAAEAKISSLPSEIEAAEEEAKQATAALKQAKADRKAAKEAMAEATAVREKEASTFAALKAELEANMGAIAKAVAALEKGMAGAFLQTDAAKSLQRLINGRDMDEIKRETLLAFLQGNPFSQGYAPSSGEIVGILKELGDDMGRDVADASKIEEDAIKVYNELMSAKTKEVQACTDTVEAKTKRLGELGIEIVNMKDDLTDTEKAFIEDKKFLADLEKNCATKTAEYEVVVRTRTEELAALAETIKVLNDDDALDLFKKTLPSPTSSFMQLGVSSTDLKRRALAILRGAQHGSHHRAQFDLIALALTGKKISFGKVLKMIDDMISMLKEEQVGDNEKKAYCLKEFDVTDDKKKALERTMSLEAAAIAKAKEAIATLKDEMAALVAGIQELDKSVAEATQQRKEENEEYNSMMAADTAAKEVLNFARNRLNKFYNPKLYVPPAKTELSAEGRIEASISGTEPPTEAPGGIADTGITVLAQHKAAPPPPPEAVSAYKTKSEENTGVIAMIDLLVADLDKQMTEGTTGEQEAQKDYETMMTDSAEKRALDSKTLAEKAEVKAATEVSLTEHEDAEKAATKEHMATLEYNAMLHADCDWLLKYFDVRKEARNGEIDSLVNAKAVLNGADYSLMQRARIHRLRA